jgi:hypothetical protein
MQWQPLVLPSRRGDSRAVLVVGPAGPTTNAARLSPPSETSAYKIRTPGNYQKENIQHFKCCILTKPAHLVCTIIVKLLYCCRFLTTSV